MALLSRQIGNAGVCGGQRLAAARPSLPAVCRPRLVAPRQRAVDARAGTEDDKKILKREEEPEEYWVSKSERKGANPLADPLAIIGLLAIFAPFGILLIAIATGLVDLSVYR